MAAYATQLPSEKTASQGHPNAWEVVHICLFLLEEYTPTLLLGISICSSKLGVEDQTILFSCWGWYPLRTTCTWWRKPRWDLRDQILMRLSTEQQPWSIWMCLFDPDFLGAIVDPCEHRFLVFFPIYLRLECEYILCWTPFVTKNQSAHSFESFRVSFSGPHNQFKRNPPFLTI